MKEKKLLFSLTKKDFEIQTMCAGGNGGQNQNKVSSAVRIVHKETGLQAVCRNHRDQAQNKKEAFRRLINSEKFQKWLKLEIARRCGDVLEVEQEVEKQMKEVNLKVEGKDEQGRWAPYIEHCKEKYENYFYKHCELKGELLDD